MSQTVPAPGAAPERSPEHPATVALPDEVSRLMPDPKKRVGKYVLVRSLGSGGMGFVMQAYDTILQRWAALKFLKSIGDDKARAYFDREARIAGQLNHPNIAAIYEVGEHESSPYIAMQFIEGENLQSARKGMARPQIVRTLREASEAVDYAHRQGVIHRDLKPSNLMLDRSGRVFVMDFGLSKHTEVGGRSAGLSGTNLVLGTPAYMPPEQARGELKSVDAQSDVYSLGATLYEMLTGLPPFVSESTAQILLQVLNVDPLPPRKFVADLPRDLETIVLKCLEKDKTRRYSNAAELADDLGRFERGEPISAHAPSLLYRFRKRILRHKVASAAILSAASLALAAASYFLGPARVEIQTPEGCVRRTYWPAGRQTLRFAHEGYDRQETELLLQPWRTARWSPPLDPDHGFVQVKTTPPGASVAFVIGGRPGAKGRADGEPFRLPKGTHEMRLELQDHVPTTLPVFVAGGKTTPIERSLEHAKGTLHITCRPEGVNLALSGRLHALPSERLELDTGRHELAFEKLNHFRRTAQVAVRPSGSAGGTSTEGNWRRNPDVGYLHVSLVRMDFWSHRTGGAVSGRPACADLDGDAVPDAVIGSTDGKLIAISGRGGAVLWEARTDGQDVYSPVLADLDADGVPDAIVSADDAGVYAFSGRDGRVLWKYQDSGSKPFPPPRPGSRISPISAVADLDGDSCPDVLVPTITSKVIALSGPTGRLLWEYAAQSLTTCARTAVDLNGDGVADGVVGTRAGGVAALSGRDGTILWKTATGGIDAAPTMSDLDRDDLPDVLAGSLDGSLTALSGKTGAVLWRFWTDGPIQSSAGIGELDGDGTPDAVVGSDDGSLYAASGLDGSWIWIASAGGPIRSSPALADLDGDRVPDVVVGSHDGFVHAFSGENGTPLWRFRTEGVVGGAPSLADLDEDGVPDVVLGSSDGSLHALAGSDRTRLWEVELASDPWKEALVASLDDDGVPDLVVAAKSWRVVAFSGTDGARLWEIQAGFQVDSLRTVPDRNRDGIPEIVLAREKPKTHEVISGRDGRPLLTNESVETEESREEKVDWDGDGIPDPIFLPKPDAVEIRSGKDQSIIGRFPAGKPVTGFHPWNRDGQPVLLVRTAGWACLLTGKSLTPAWVLGSGRPIAATGGRLYVAQGRRVVALLPLPSRLSVPLLLREGLLTSATAEWEVGADRRTSFRLRGLARFRSGDLQGAIEDFRESKRLGSRSPELHADLVEALLKTDRLTSADLADLPPAAVPLLHDGARFSSAELHRLADRATGGGIPMLLLALKSREAWAELEKCDSYDSRVLSLRALARLQRMDEAGARADLQRAILLNPYDRPARKLLQTLDMLPNPKLYRQRGASNQASKKLAQAMIDFDLAIRMKEDEPNVYVDRGLLKKELGNVDGAVADFTRAIDLKTEDDRAYFERGKVKADRQDWGGAIADYDEALRRNPGRDLLRYFRGLARYYKHDLEGALADFDAEIEAGKDSSSHSRYFRGLVKRDRGDIAGALADFTRAIELKDFAVWSYVERGKIQANRKQWDEAIQDYTAALALDKKTAAARYWRGEAYLAKGRRAEALGDFDECVALDGKFWRALLSRGRLRREAGEYAAALADFDRLVAMWKDWAEGYFHRGETRRLMKEYDAAITDLTRALDLDPKYVLAWNSRAIARDGKGDVDGAIADYDQAIKLMPNAATLYSNRALSKAKRNDFDGAIADFTCALELRPKGAGDYLGRGRAKEAKGDFPGAIGDYEKALEVGGPGWSDRPAAEKALENARKRRGP